MASDGRLRQRLEAAQRERKPGPHENGAAQP